MQNWCFSPVQRQGRATKSMLGHNPCSAVSDTGNSGAGWGTSFVVWQCKTHICKKKPQKSQGQCSPGPECLFRGLWLSCFCLSRQLHLSCILPLAVPMANPQHPCIPWPPWVAVAHACPHKSEVATGLGNGKQAKRSLLLLLSLEWQLL